MRCCLIVILKRRSPSQHKNKKKEHKVGLLTTYKYSKQARYSATSTTVSYSVAMRTGGLLTSKRIQPSATNHGLSVSYVTLGWPTQANSALRFLLPSNHTRPFAGTAACTLWAGYPLFGHKCSFLWTGDVGKEVLAFESPHTNQDVKPKKRQQP